MSWQILSSGHRTARKQHRCIWCGEAIEPKTRYAHTAGIFDGEFQDNKFHVECDDACARYFRDYNDDYFEPYEFARGSAGPKGEPVQ